MHAPDAPLSCVPNINISATSICLLVRAVVLRFAPGPVLVGIEWPVPAAAAAGYYNWCVAAVQCCKKLCEVSPLSFDHIRLLYIASDIFTHSSWPSIPSISCDFHIVTLLQIGQIWSSSGLSSYFSFLVPGCVSAGSWSSLPEAGRRPQQQYGFVIPFGNLRFCIAEFALPRLASACLALPD